MLEAFEVLKQEIIQEVLSEVRKELADVKQTNQVSNKTIGVKEACEIIGMSRNPFMAIVKAGKIPYHMAGTHFRFDQRDIEYYKAKMKVKKKVKGISA
ncbi:TPA: helix-turn-helix domain-containing protein [Streptococcus suis]|uniref:helix-turn-helix domain-containing protein n=1 Tax=Streptococcus suis TaxID=1307 RepID=UPI0005CD37AF|nr:helix-turn-helix domain-containing protein [Streptococcus suis]MCB2917472.1 helix-turn-helix domain-containing protein [Streptococcus suis]MCB2923915.1 helix-turn-helix domain-containing protein [Streptococcus suis]NQG03329.1 helix-turn-helix domain-containing protein [Streptococcus suis]HEL1861505.1 helix-turn-helix domain-containing protein [Streptococcus suis]HEL1887961.1 helix-turn-helix domain-containing protein [Streptococcus suis]